MRVPSRATMKATSHQAVASKGPILLVALHYGYGHHGVSKPASKTSQQCKAHIHAYKNHVDVAHSQRRPRAKGQSRRCMYQETPTNRNVFPAHSITLGVIPRFHRRTNGSATLHLSIYSLAFSVVTSVLVPQKIIVVGTTSTVKISSPSTAGVCMRHGVTTQGRGRCNPARTS